MIILSGHVEWVLLPREKEHRLEERGDVMRGREREERVESREEEREADLEKEEEDDEEVEEPEESWSHRGSPGRGSLCRVCPGLVGSGCRCCSSPILAASSNTGLADKVRAEVSRQAAACTC